jgi:hypothetical protein
MYTLVQNTTQSGTDNDFSLIEFSQKCQIYLGTEYFLTLPENLEQGCQKDCVLPLCSQIDSMYAAVIYSLDWK